MALRNRDTSDANAARSGWAGLGRLKPRKDGGRLGGMPLAVPERPDRDAELAGDLAPGASGGNEGQSFLFE